MKDKNKIIELENEIISETKKVVDNIVLSKPKLSISAKSRAGAEISAYLEDEFEKNFYKYSKKINDVEKSPMGATKNPWDLKFNFKYGKHKEEIWVDFKAIKISSLDSNPDIGTPNKVINIINNGFFYILFVYVYYDEDPIGLKFEKVNNNYSKIYFLKDIDKSFRRNPKNQLQVNASSQSTYRSRNEFLDLLFDKIKESHERQIEISKKALLNLENLKKETKEKNTKLIEDIIKKT